MNYNFWVKVAKQWVLEKKVRESDNVRNEKNNVHRKHKVPTLDELFND